MSAAQSLSGTMLLIFSGLHLPCGKWAVLSLDACYWSTRSTVNLSATKGPTNAQHTVAQHAVPNVLSRMLKNMTANILLTRLRC